MDISEAMPVHFLKADLEEITLPLLNEYNHF